jgi:hypothetical protein
VLFRSFHGRIAGTLEAYAALLAGDRRAVTNQVATMSRAESPLAMVVAAWSGDGAAFDRALREARQRLMLPGGRSLARQVVGEAALAWERRGDAVRAEVCRALGAEWSAPAPG